MPPGISGQPHLLANLRKDKEIHLKKALLWYGGHIVHVLMEGPSGSGLSVCTPAMRETWGSIWVGRSPGEGRGYPLHYCLENPMNGRARWGYSPRLQRVGHDWRLHYNGDIVKTPFKSCHSHEAPQVIWFPKKTATGIQKKQDQCHTGYNSTWKYILITKIKQGFIKLKRINKQKNTLYFLMHERIFQNLDSLFCVAMFWPPPPTSHIEYKTSTLDWRMKEFNMW